MNIRRISLLLFVVFAHYTWAADVSFSPSPANVDVDDIFISDIVGADFQGVVDGGGVSFNFDPAVVNVLSVSIDPVFWNFVNSEGTINNVAGTVSDILVSDFPGVSDSNFTVATVEFQAVGAGSTALVLTESSINPFASGGQLVNPTFTNGTVDVQATIQPDGDINEDGLVNVVDVLLAGRAVIGDITLTSGQLQHADVAPLVNGVPAPDGMFNPGDVLVITRKALGMVSF